MTSDRAGKPVRIVWKTNAWANVNRRNHGNEFHTHPGAYWSGTYYVDDAGGIGDDPRLGGEFEMQDLRGVAPAMYAPLLGFAVPGGQSAERELVRPTSARWCCSRPGCCTPSGCTRRARASVAFNFGL